MLTVNANESDVTKLITTRKLRVLLLDDDKFTLEFVGDMLLELGVAEVVKAENGVVVQTSSDSYRFRVER